MLAIWPLLPALELALEFGRCSGRMLADDIWLHPNDLQVMMQLCTLGNRGRDHSVI
jgi:hypothetical protein